MEIIEDSAVKKNFLKSATYDIAVIALISALLIAGKFVLQFIPNVEIVSSLIIIFTCTLGIKRTLPAVLIFCLLDNLLYPFFFLVTIQYFIHFPLLCVLSKLIIRNNKPNLKYNIIFVLFIGLMALAFWIETPIINELFGFTKFMPTMIAGIPFMVPMLISNIAVLAILYLPLCKAVKRVGNRIGSKEKTEPKQIVD